MDMVDDHYYKRAEQFFADVHHYDKADRSGPKIFVGEWATREGNPTPNMGAALGDAAWMTGMERNSDLILLSSYAPLLVNVNPSGMQWPSDLIGYDANSSYGSPSYYAQAMFASHIGTEILGADLQGAGDRLFTSVTRDPAKALCCEAGECVVGETGCADSAGRREGREGHREADQSERGDDGGNEFHLRSEAGGPGGEFGKGRQGIHADCAWVFG